MNENAVIPTDRRNLWIRGLYMLLMALILHVAGTVLFVIAFIQFAIMLVSASPNARLVTFGRSLAHYFRQIADFLTFAVEQKPFPFDDWPASE